MSTNLTSVPHDPNSVLLNTVQLVSLGIYTGVATVIGLIGNAIVLYSSIRFD